VVGQEAQITVRPTGKTHGELSVIGREGLKDNSAAQIKGVS